jgi:hypothetical protein
MALHEVTTRRTRESTQTVRLALLYNGKIATNTNKPQVNTRKYVNVIVKEFRLQDNIVNDDVVSGIDQGSHSPAHPLKEPDALVTISDSGIGWLAAGDGNNIQASPAGGAFWRIQAPEFIRQAIPELIQGKVLPTLWQGGLKRSGQGRFARA